MSLVNALTIDVEDYYHVSAFERHIDRRDWPQHESRVVASTQRLLDLLAARGVKATFFVLGWVADSHPDLVRQIHAGGHEIGSHSYWHRLVYSLTPHEFRQDLRRSRGVLQEITGQPVNAYRAPSFSVTGRSLWALDILREEGITCDSSVFPIRHDRYGIPGAQRHLHLRQTASGPLWEFPPAVLRRAGVNLPVGGGGYFRLYPSRFTHYALARINRVAGKPFAFYTHPWEVDPGQPRLAAGTVLSRRRHYLGLRRTAGRLSGLLDQFAFAPLRECIAREEAEAGGNGALPSGAKCGAPAVALTPLSDLR